MINEEALLESESLRANMVSRTEALDRVKRLRSADGTGWATTPMVAEYFGVGETVVRALVHDHRNEMTANGYRTLTGPELSYFKQLSGITTRSRALAVFTRRTVLNVAMLLRDSVVARQVRTHLLDAESAQRSAPSTPPVDNSVFDNLEKWLDARVLHHVEQRLAEWGPSGTRDEARLRVLAEDAVRSAVGRAVVPLLNELIRSDAELRHRLAEHQDEIARLHTARWKPGSDAD